MTETSTRDPDTTRAALVNAARRAFAARGFAGARTQQIADEAGVNKALILYHFGGKQGLYTAVVTQLIARAQEAIDAAVDAGATPVERLDRFIAELGRFLGEEPDFPMILMREQMDGAHRLETEVRQRFFGFFGRLREIIEQGIAGGAFRPLDPHSTHLSLVGSLVMFQLTRPARETYIQQGDYTGPVPEWEAYVQHVRRLFARGLEPTQPNEQGDEPCQPITE